MKKLETYIDKDKSLPIYKDFFQIREKGIALIQRLCETSWTDHNAHDPGITMLEVLAHAISDLGYRTDLPAEDIFFTEDSNDRYFPAHEILTHMPVTVTDYRKLLARVKDVRNAWVFPIDKTKAVNNRRYNNHLIYADCYDRKLSLKAKNREGNKNHPVYINGFYEILLELEIHEEFGSLNNYDLTERVESGDLKDVILTVKTKEMPANSLDGKIQLDDLKKVESTRWEALISSPSGHKQNFEIVLIEDKPYVNRPAKEVTTTALQPLVFGLVAQYLKKHKYIKSTIERVKYAFHQHRNLCEDLLRIDLVESVDISICADIELSNDADMEVVQAKVFHAIENYFNPPIPFSSLKELQDKEVPVEEIFNSPYIDYEQCFEDDPVFTKHGFITTEQIETTAIREEIYSSDIINLIVDIEGVIAVKELLMSPYENDVIGKSERWCLNVSENRQPIFDMVRSKLLFFKQGIPFRAKPEEFQSTLRYLKDLSHKKAQIGKLQRLELPEGKNRNLGQHYSILNDFPQNYGVGPLGVSPNATEERRLQAKQLQGYLSIFDQILADYLSQLHNAKDLLSFQKEDGSEIDFFSYYTQNLSKGNSGYSQELSDELFPANFDNETRRSFLESKANGYKRRSKMLDHLLARYNEQLKDGFLINNEFSFLGTGEATLKKRPEEELLKDKAQFLKHYPQLSRERGTGYCYLGNLGTKDTDKGIWDTGNVSGLKKRITRLAGIDDDTRKSLVCTKLFDELFSVSGQGPFRWTISGVVPSTLLNPPVQEFFTSRKSFVSEDKAKEDMALVFPYLRLPDNTKVLQNENTDKFFIQIENEYGQILATSNEKYDDYQTAVTTLRSFWRAYDLLLQTQDLCKNEGFHLIEHLLFRPLNNLPNSPLMDVCIDEDCTFCGEEDPYSFRMTLLFPYWHVRFRRPEVRHYIEQLVREETPPHIHVKICWIGNGQMLAFETAYKKWLLAKANCLIDGSEYNKALGQLLLIMNRLITQHPEATLHDCEEDSDDNPVQLGRTNLGIF